MRTLFVVAAVVLAVVAQDCKPVINWDNGNKYSYDLSVLHHDPMNPHMAYDEDFNYYFINFCGATDSGCTDGSAVCQRANNYNYYSCGAASTASYSQPDDKTFSAGSALSVTYTGGDTYTSGQPRQSTVTVICDPDETGPEGDWISVTEDENAYFLFVEHASGCGTLAGSSGGSSGDKAALAILLILIFGFILYFVIGWILNKFVFHKEGSFFELLPQYLFWVSLPGLLKDGCLFIGHGFKKGDYVSV